MTITLQPLEEAIARISARTPIGSKLRSSQWSRVPVQLRESAFFSSTIESIRLLDEAQSGIKDVLSMTREQTARGEALIDRSVLIDRLRKVAQDEGIYVDPTKRGGLQDITSRRRLGMIIDIQTEQAREYARWLAEQDADVLDAFPAQELVRLEDREVPRKWRERWAQAGGKFFGGRMIALKNDPIWSRISRFGVPWPPFDFNSGMGLEDIDRSEAEDLGLLKPGDTVQPMQEDFNAKLQASVRGLSPRALDQLKSVFGDQIEIDGDTVRWTGGTK